MPPVVACPKCQRQVSLPETAEPAEEVWVRCPLCSGTYRLQEALSHAPPMLEIIRPQTIQPEPYSFVSSLPTEQSVAAPALPQPEDQEPEFPPLGLPPQDLDFTSVGHLAAGPAGSESTDQPQPAGRKRRQKNPIVELIKIVLGGAVGLLIGYAILFWGFSTDPARLRDKLPSFLVPAALRKPEPQPTAGRSNGSSRQLAQTQPETNPSPFVAGPEPQPVSPQPVDALPLHTQSEAESPVAAASADSLQPTTESAALPEQAPPQPDAMATLQPPATVDQPPVKSEPEPAPLQVESPKPAVPAVLNAPIYTIADLDNALQSAQQASEAAKSQGAAKGARLKALYHRALYQLAQVATFTIGESAPGDLDRRREAIKNLILDDGSEKARDDLAFYANNWLAAGNKRDSAGIVAFGTIKSTSDNGRYYFAQLKTTGRDDPLHIVSPSPLDLAPRDKAVVLGVILPQPKVSLSEYQGPAGPVIWLGQLIDVARSAPPAETPAEE